MKSKPMNKDDPASAAARNKRLEMITWGLFLIVVGIACIWSEADVSAGDMSEPAAD